MSSVFCTTPSFSYAQEEKSETEVSVDLKDLSNAARNEILRLKKEAEEKVNSVTIKEEIKNYAGLGKELALAVQELCTTLGVQVENFSKTSIGKMCVFILMFKIIGRQLLGLAVIALLYLLLMWNFRRFHVPERVKNKDSNGKIDIKYVKRYNFDATEAKIVSTIFHGVCFIALTIITLVFLLA